MRTSKLTLKRLGSLVILSSLLVLVWMLVCPSTGYANGTPKPPPPPPPPATPTNTPKPSDTPEPTDTPKPTDPPEPTDTDEPTATPTASNTPMPTTTPKPSNTSDPGQAPPGTGQTEGSLTSPDCRSSVEGAVTDRSGQEATGATVLIEGESWSDRILTDDNGHYGFAALCAGTATLKAYLADGQVSLPARIVLNGQDSVQVNLSAAPFQGTVVATAAIAQQTATPEPDLPATGYSGWLLAGAALLGLLLLLSAGMRRVFGERTQDHN